MRLQLAERQSRLVEAIKLDRRTRRTCPLQTPGGAIEVVDPEDELRLSRAAGRGRGRREGRGPVGAPGADCSGCTVLGLSYEEIAAQTGDSRRTVERQILRARDKLAGR